jgi:regulator of cell morphogenesis and NO signaling
MNADNVVLDISKDPAEFFMNYNALYQGDELIIHDDCDPKYLYYQLLSKNGPTFSWQYLENGPGLWLVKIIKEKVVQLPTLGQLAAGDYRKAQVFKKYGLDYCFGGKKTLHEACSEKNISFEKVQRKLYLAGLQPCVNNVNYNIWELDFMADFIENTHHQYVKESVLRVQELNKKVVKLYASSYPHLEGINLVFQQLSREIIDNIEKEEQSLFPFIRFLVQVKRGKVSASGLPGSLQQTINALEAEHEAVGQYMKDINGLTDNYTLPDSANFSIALLYTWLHSFEDDLHQHVHLENNILFPQALELEKEYKIKSSTIKSDSIQFEAYPGNHRDFL